MAGGGRPPFRFRRKGAEVGKEERVGSEEEEEEEEERVGGVGGGGGGGIGAFWRKLEARDAAAAGSAGGQGQASVRFFDRGGYYTVHGERAGVVAELYLSRSEVKVAEGLPTVVLSSAMFRSVVRDLLLERGGYRVEVYVGDGGGSWVCDRWASPGHVERMEDDLFQWGATEMQQGAVAMCAVVSCVAGERRVGVACVDAVARRLGVLGFVDCDRLRTLEAAAVHCGAKECVVLGAGGGADDAEHRRLCETLARGDIMVTEAPGLRARGGGAGGAEDDVMRDLEILLRPGTGVQKAAQDAVFGGGGGGGGASATGRVAAEALRALVRHVGLLADEACHGSYALGALDLGAFVRMDAAAVRALNLLPHKSDLNKRASVYGLLNRCKTAMGSRELLRWVKQPLRDAAKIRERHDVVAVLSDDDGLRRELRDKHLGRIPDIARLAHRLQRAGRVSTGRFGGAGAAGLRELVRVYQAAAQVPLLAETLELSPGSSPLLRERYAAPLRQCAEDGLYKFMGLVEAAVDLDAVPDEYRICAKYSPELGELSAEREQIRDGIHRLHEKAMRGLGLGDKLKLERKAQYGYHYRVSRKDEKAVRGDSKFTRLCTLKDGVKFVDSALSSLSKQYEELEQRYARAQGSLVDKVMGIAAGYAAPVLEPLAAVLTELDILCAFADLSACAPVPYTRPEVTDGGDIVLLDCRHPCVEVQEGVAFIPNTVELSVAGGGFQIITGPNMGGKSTYIRAAGVAVLLAQIGCFVPCAAGSRVSLVDGIFCRVGAGDCQLKGVSTFMAEMLETAAILRSATSRSLVIVDELGRGTSTYDGFGLAWAISEHLCDVVRCPTLFATHFHELTGLAAERPGRVVNRHVGAEVGSGTITFLYKVAEGSCDQSFGIHVAELARFPREVIDAARAKAAELEDFSGGGGGVPAAAGGDEGPRTKKARVEEGEPSPFTPEQRREGSAAARLFMKRLCALPLESLEEAAAEAQVEALRAEFKAGASGNPYLTSLLAADGAAR